MLDFLIAWIWYLVAFALGAVIALLLAARFVPPRSADEAFDDIPEARPVGGGQR